MADLERSKAFYRDVLGFRVAEQDPKHGDLFMTLGEDFHTLDMAPHESPETARGLGRPLGVVLASLLFGALHAGAPLMQAQTSTPVDIVEVLQALIVLFVAAPPLIRAIYRLRAARASGVAGLSGKGLA